jgi:hypothetical protein
MQGSWLGGLGLAAALAWLPVYGATYRNAQVIPLHNGFNTITLGGHPATLVLAWRENYNAHGFAVATMYARGLEQSGGQSIWQLVPVFQREGVTPDELGTLTASGGADCLLHSFRLFTLPHDARTWLAIAQREMGETYGDSMPVHFDIYRTVQNDDGDVGSPPLSFVYDHSQSSRQPYCDVDQAFEHELGLKPIVLSPYWDGR